MLTNCNTKRSTALRPPARAGVPVRRGDGAAHQLVRVRVRVRARVRVRVSLVRFIGLANPIPLTLTL
jgi:hypothetical protein